ncbi:MAG TPA: sialidase family protein [Bryobacterales bacterium]|nr:sialidase family protein [Bryobacterales bacterium]
MSKAAAPLWIALAAGVMSFRALGQDVKVKTELSEFIFEKAPFAQCHASTILELPDGKLLAAWFGGKHEGDNSVEIWMSRKPKGGTWSLPEAMTHFSDVPKWNPVLFRDAGGRVWLFFKVGPNEREWIGAYRISEDNGSTWSDVTYLPAGLLGPIRSKPILLSDGAILAGTSVEAYQTYTAWMLRSTDSGRTWTIHGPLVYDGIRKGLIQPTVWETKDGRVRALMRSTRAIGAIVESTSTDGGRTWGPVTKTALPNPDAAIDAVKMTDGRVALVFNNTATARSPLNLAFSEDDGKTWGTRYILENEPGEYSYPAVIQGRDGNLYITYTWKRERIKHVVVNPRGVKTR